MNWKKKGLLERVGFYLIIVNEKSKLKIRLKIKIINLEKKFLNVFIGELWSCDDEQPAGSNITRQTTIKYFYLKIFFLF